MGHDSSPLRGDVRRRRSRVGHAGLRTWFHDWYEAFEDFEHECLDLIDADEHVVSVGIDRAHGRESGVRVDRRIVGVWTIREGKVARVVWFESIEEAREFASQA